MKTLEPTTALPFHGSSMRPLFTSGEEVLVELFPQPRVLDGAFQPGEILLYKDTGGEWVCHRYLGEAGGGHLLKGDNTIVYEKISRLSVWGRVKGVRKSDGDYYLRPGAGLDFLCACQKRQCEASSFFVKKFNRLLCFAILFFYRAFFVSRSDSPAR